MFISVQLTTNAKEMSFATYGIKFVYEGVKVKRHCLYKTYKIAIQNKNIYYKKKKIIK